MSIYKPLFFLNILLFVFATPRANALPAGWSIGEVGNSGVLKGSSREAAGVWTLTSKDGAKHIAYQTRSDAFTITARVLSSNGGFVVRNSLASDSVGIEFLSNLTANRGNQPAYWASNGKGAWGPSNRISITYGAPLWLRLERYRNCTRMSASADGKRWDPFETWDNEYGGGQPLPWNRVLL